MASSPPGSPAAPSQRPMSAFIRPAPRSNGILSPNGGKNLGGGSRASDEDGKTSVRVAVRVRPPLRPSDPGFELIPQRFQRSMVQVTSPTSLAVESPQGRKLFVFDRVFGEEVNQEGVWEYLVESVNSFVQGYNVSMLAYGQSGAGKSYTMGTSGPAEQNDLDVMGVIPRAASALFEKLDGPRPANNRSSMSHLRTPTRYSGGMQQFGKPAEKNWTLKATYVEIYNEQLRDLLVPEYTPQHERSVVSIREDIKGNILLTGLHAVDITSVDDLLSALNFGSMIRQTDSTAINAKSSRSHAVFSLNLVQRKRGAISAAEKRLSVPIEAITGNENWVTTDSKLHFVDLAGSERLKNTGAQGERAKEGISINAGLASLGKVISQLSSRSASSHISYRDSKLTRLLQDSLGGNAITYMIACVTPAEFHISETLNTVQYAQRARAIQSRPQIQQISDESDKQALIDRLKAEVAFLRDQIRSNDRSGDRRVHGVDRPERPNDREIELQNQLLDIQENYTALSQRHAKFISEMTKARDGELAENLALEETLGDSATERLKRSNSFAEAVEQVVLEYEKTIQSLEQSLSSTRGSLSNTETALLERETKYSYIETVNQQLQARLQKLMDRESSTENYLHDLEAKLDGHTSGEEKNSTIVMELRKEIARVRENEASCEDYISTLEERLAEADSDAELMQREIDRLEHVVQRQRSLGKLDNLLHELDNIQQDPASQMPLVNGAKARDRKQNATSRRAAENVILEREESEGDVESDIPAAIQGSEADGPADNGESIEVEGTGEKSLKQPATTDYPLQSPAQSKFVADKLENVTQELFDLRVEHESTVNEYDVLSSKYEEALRTLAELQDAVDEARHPNGRYSLLSASSSHNARPVSFFADARVNELKEIGGSYSSSRSLSSELSSAGDLQNTTEHSDAEPAIRKSEPVDVRNGAHTDDKAVEKEIEKLRALAAEKEQAHALLTEKYEQLHEEHQDTLDVVEDLKTEVTKARSEQTSPRSASPIIRRKSSQNVMIIDRAHRSFASLRNIATENFDKRPDVMQNFELNLNTAMHELHSRSERVQELEADIAAVKKEMEAKMTIISGLTRERSSIRGASPMDMSVVSSLQSQLMQNEAQMRMLQEKHQAREKELSSQIEELRTSLDSFKQSKEVEEKPSEINGISAQDGRIADLEAELASWEGKYQAVLASRQESERKHLATIADLESRVPSKSTGAALVGGGLLAGGAAIAGAALLTNHSKAAADEQLKAPHEEAVNSLKKETDEHKASIAANAARVAELEKAHTETQAQLEEATKSKDAASNALEVHRELITNLEKKIAGHEEAVKAHQDALSTLQTTHAKEVAELKSSAAADHEAQLADISSKHQVSISALQSELNASQGHLTKLATQVAAASGVDVSPENLEERISALIEDQKALAGTQKLAKEHEKTIAELVLANETVVKELDLMQAEMAASHSESADFAKLKDEHASLSEQLVVLKKEMANLESKNKKNSRLVEELEDQLASNFDQHQIANNRLSNLQSERNVQLEDANAAHARAQVELAAIKEEYASLQAKYEDIQADLTGTKRSNSTNLRKSASVASLPSPPPAIPLPPLPPIMGSSVSPNGGTPAISVSPPPTGRPISKDVANAQIQEDQEARIRAIEKHLIAEKQLTTALEEALSDLERQSGKFKADCDAWRRRAMDLDQEVKELRDRPEQENRWSVHEVEEERKKRKDAEIARAHLEERMNAINKKKKKGSTLNCF